MATIAVGAVACAMLSRLLSTQEDRPVVLEVAHQRYSDDENAGLAPLQERVAQQDQNAPPRAGSGREPAVYGFDDLDIVTHCSTSSSWIRLACRG